MVRLFLLYASLSSWQLLKVASMMYNSQLNCLAFTAPLALTLIMTVMN